jgi:hypothetical protein
MSCRDYDIDLMSAVPQAAADFDAMRKSSALGHVRKLGGCGFG